MRWPGVLACLGGFHEVERSGVVGRHRAALGQCRRVGASAARWGCAERGADRSVAEWSEVKSRRVRRPGRPAKCRELARWLATA